MRTRHARTSLSFVYDATGDGDIVVQHIEAMQNPAISFKTAENHDRFRASVTLLSNHAAYTFVYQPFFSSSSSRVRSRTALAAGGAQSATRPHATAHHHSTEQCLEDLRVPNLPGQCLPGKSVFQRGNSNCTRLAQHKWVCLARPS